VFGSIGGPEVILLFILALLIFGPRKLPELGRSIGKAMSDFRRATNDFKSNLEREVQVDALKDAALPLQTSPAPASLARGALADIAATLAAPAPQAPAAPAPDAAPESGGDPPSDGGTDSVH
jgi:TatA/E family protein of Tat protein translocase